ncbi:MAG: glycoside hydrolase family 88 protein [Prolixibacteraceae bacterium]
MYKVMFLFLTCLMTFALGNHPVYAKVIVVSSGKTGTEINAKIGKVQPGDTLLLKKGYYKINFNLKNIHGLPDKPVVIRGEERMSTTIDGGAFNPAGDQQKYGFCIEESSWITIDNFSFKNCWIDAIRVINSSYISLTNSNIEGGRRAMYAEGRKSHHFLIENCYWEQGEHVWTKENQYSWEELHHGKFRYYNGSLFQSRMISGSFVLRDNYLKNVYNGFRLSVMGEAENDTLAGTNGEIYRNVIENSADNAFEPEVYCKNLHFYHNKMINSHAFISVTEVGGGPLYFYGNTGVKLPDCNDGWTIFKFMGKDRRLTKPIYIFKNSWQTDSDVLGRKKEQYWHNDNIRHFNNAYYITNSDTVGIYYLGANNVFENDCSNIPFPERVTQKAKYQSMTVDPMFVDGKYGNFLLRNESPCRDKGIIPEGIIIGFTGDKLDIGAYDDDRLVEGPPFRYMDPGTEMPDQEKPRIVRHKTDKNMLKLWFSYPLDASTVQAKDFVLKQNGTEHSFHDHSLQENGYLLILRSSKMLPSGDISLYIQNKPRGTNGEEMSFWASTIASATPAREEQVLNTVRKVADRMIRNTTFSLEPKVITFNANVARLCIDQDLLKKAGEVAYGLIAIHAEEAKEAILGFSFRGNMRVFLNNRLICSGKSDEENFREYTYNRFEFANEVKVNLRKGENQLLVKCGGGYDGGVFSCCVQKPDGMFDDEVLIKNDIDNSYINNWLVTTPFILTEGNAIDSIFGPERSIREYYRQNGRIISWKLQSPMTGQAFTTSKNQTKKGFDADWHYANSNALLGILNLYKVSYDYRYKRFVEMYNKQVTDHYDFFKEQYFSKRVLRGTYFRLFRATMLDDTGGAILPIAEMAVTEKPQGLQRDILDQTLNYVLHKQSRLADGTFCRPEPVRHTVWADDLFMSVPFILRMAKINNDAGLYDTVALQIINFNKYLTDTKTNLYRHGWYDQEKRHSPAAWSRANGWMIWATSEALLEIPRSHKDYKKIKDLFVTHLKAILTYQSQSGLWHQVIDRPDSYPETSGTAMFAIGLARAINNKWIPDTYSAQLLRAWDAVRLQTDQDGIVHGICRGTDMGENTEYYMRQEPLDNDPRGLGAVLTLGSEMYHFFRSRKVKSF